MLSNLAQFAFAQAGLAQLQQLILRIIALMSGLAITAIVVMFVYAGIRFMISNGEPKNIQAAQQIVSWAVIGAACLVLSWVILLIIGNFTGTTQYLTNLCLDFGNCSN